MKKLLIALAGLTCMTAPSVANADATITYGSTTAIPSVNDFKTQLNNLGYTTYANNGATISVAPGDVITFYFLGSESGFSDTFSTNGATPTTLTETSSFENHFGSPVLIGTDTFTAGGSLAGLLNFTTDGLLQGGQNATVGDAGFGIFLGPNDVSGETVNQFYLGYDDSPVTGDDNHDDFVVWAVISALPEPSTWAMMLMGFAGVGLAVRRQRKPAIAQVA